MGLKLQNNLRIREKDLWKGRNKDALATVPQWNLNIYNKLPKGFKFGECGLLRQKYQKVEFTVIMKVNNSVKKDKIHMKVNIMMGKRAY